MDIVEFLRARLNEDEADAREADGSRWLHEDKIVTFQFWSAEHGEMDWDTFVSTDTRANGYHIARHDPARVLREVEAKRRIVERHAGCEDVSYGDASTCPDIRDLALVYADHPDYDPEWR